MIDLSLLEPIVYILGPDAAYALTGVPKPRLANGSNSVSPRNAYVALSGSTQRMAEKIFEAIGRAELNQDPCFVNSVERSAHSGEIDEMIGAWVGSRDCAEVL